MTSVAISEAPEVRSTWLTPRHARTTPIHRWFVFPHSFAPELVGWLVEDLQIERGMTLLDPFCGAGTTLLEGEARGLVPVGVDLLPVAVLASSAKLIRPSRSELQSARLLAVEAARHAEARTAPSPLLRRALTPTAHGRLAAAMGAVDGAARDCVRLATLSLARRFSRLVADGGWLRETQPELSPRRIPEALDDALRRMEEDVSSAAQGRGVVYWADARSLPIANESIDAVITSPPYPNRHDYTRVFAVELELGWDLADSVKGLRYAALHSHPEARSPKTSENYVSPSGLDTQVALVTEKSPDPRIPRMLAGYFADMWLVLNDLARVLRPGGVAALVVGNAQYAGVPIPVDEHLSDLARRAGFDVKAVVSMRERGNSAQQMAAYGRHPARESAVLLRRP